MSDPKKKTKSVSPPPAPTIEIATAKRDYTRYQAYLKYCKNPDPVLNKTKDGAAKGIELFAEMKRDCHISSCLLRLTTSVTRFPWAVNPGGDTPQDIEAAEFINEQIKKHYYDLINGILDAIPMGFSVQEFWCKINEKAEIAALKKRRQARFCFDENGLLRLKTESNSREGEELPQEQFLVATYREEDDNRFGEAALSECFWPWWFKKNGLLFWANYLERFNQPVAVGTFPANTIKDKQDLFLAALEAIQNDFAITIPDGWKVELIKGMDSASTDSYERFQDFMDRAISKALLSAVVAQGTEKYGTRSANEVLKDISDEVVEAAAEFAAKTINDQLIARLCDWNFELEQYPVFAILYKTKKISMEEAEKIEILGRAGVAIPAEKVYEAEGWPVPEDDTLVIYKSKMILYRDVAKENERDVTTGAPAVFGELTEIKTDGGTMEIKGRSGTDRLIDAGNQHLDRLYAAALPDLQKAAETGRLIELVEKSQDFTQASKAVERYDPKGLEEKWRVILEMGRLLGEYSAQRQIAALEFADPVIDYDELWTKLKPEEVLAWIRAKIPVQKDVYDALSRAAKNAAFYVSGLVRVGEINWVKKIMLEALEQGKTFVEFKKTLALRSGGDPYFANMETAFYTNIHQAQTAQESAALYQVRDELPYRRYVAVRDHLTRPEHAAANDTVARWDDPIWTKLYQYLMDFNCRCRIVVASEDDYARHGNPAAEAERRAGGETFSPAALEQNISGLATTLQNKEEYQKYLTIAIRNLIQVKDDKQQ